MRTGTQPPLPANGVILAAAWLLVLLSLAAPSAQQQQQQQEQGHTSDPRGSEVLACINSAPECSDAKAITSWDHLLDNKHSCLTVRRAWWSPGQPRIPVTLITQLSVNRLQQLRAQCQTWSGPLAAALYLPLLNPGPELSAAAQRRIQAAESDIEDLYVQSLSAHSSSRSGCQLRLVLVYELFDTERAAAVLYPVNSLRNLARLMADTPLITNIDVDMLPSVSLSASLQASGSGSGVGSTDGSSSSSSMHDYVKGCVEDKQVYVIPAFETTCKGPSTADSAALHGKEHLQGMIRERCVSQFRERVAPAAHNVTDFGRWFQASEPYSIEYANEFEPWFLGARDTTQWFDYRFRGYGKNKIVQVAATAALGWKFKVHPTGFIVHRAHPESQSRKAFLKVKFKSRHNAELLTGSLYKHIEALWAEAQEQMAKGTYQPELDAAVKACLAALPWWKTTAAAAAAAAA